MLVLLMLYNRVISELPRTHQLPLDVKQLSIVTTSSQLYKIQYFT